MDIKLRKKYRIETKKAPREVLDTIEASLGSPWKFSGNEPFSGKIKETTFKIAPRNAFRNAFRPTLHGKIRKNEFGGSSVFVDARLHPIIRAFSFLWLLGVCFFLINGIFTGVPQLILISLFFFLFYFLLSRLAFYFAEKESRKRLANLLKDA